VNPGPSGQLPGRLRRQEVAGKNATFEVTVKKVEEPKLPNWTPSLPDRWRGDGDLARCGRVKANVEREVKKRIESDIKQKVMQALLDSTQIELPKSLVEIEIQRLQQQARADLESRGVKMDQVRSIRRCSRSRRKDAWPWG